MVPTYSVKVSDARASAVVVLGLNATWHRDGRGAVRRGARRERECEQEDEQSSAVLHHRRQR